MDSRTDYFFRRFTSAKSHLKAHNIQGLVSLKYRDDCVNNAEYSHFIDGYLRAASNLTVDPVKGEFGGQAWLVRDKSQNRAILVEHETGLEILAVLGSIASLISLLPLISSGWTKLRDRFSHRHFDHPTGIEIRRFDQRNVLIEEETPSVEVYVFNLTLHDQELLKQKVELLEAEIDDLKKKQLPKKKSPALKSRRKPRKHT